MRMCLAQLNRVCLAAAFAVVCFSGAFAQMSDDASSYASFFDETVSRQLEESEIAGAVVAVVENGEVAFLKGYGVADRATSAAVDPKNSMFRIASVSKLFTAVAVMQLVQRGALDLDTDIREYVDFDVRAPLGSVTLRHLLTHRAGFEDFAKNRFLPLPELLQPLSDYVQTSMPSQIYAPGAVPSYSSYSFSLAGHVVEQASGETFEGYVAEKIFEPLGMTRSSFTQPLPEALARHAVKGYAPGAEVSRAYEIIGGTPQGGMAASGADMAQFMLWVLDAFKEHKGAQSTSVMMQQMLTPQYVSDPRLGAMGIGFYRTNRNGLALWGHSGSSQDFRSHLLISPEKDLGFFAVLSGDGIKGRDEAGVLSNLFFDRYFPYTEVIELESGLQRKSDIAGRYRSTRRSETTLFALLTPLMYDVLVSVTDDGGVTVSSIRMPDGQPVVFYPAGEGVFQSADTGQAIAFRNVDGKYVLEPGPPLQFYVKDEGLSRQTLSKLLGLIFAGAALGFLTLIWRRFKPNTQVSERRFSFAPPLAAMAAGAGWVGLCWFFLRGLSDYTLLSSESDALLVGVYAFAALAVLLMALSIFSIASGIAKRGFVRALLPDGIFLVISLVSIMLFYHFNVLRFSMQY